MAADKLALYNEALGHLGERRLASLAENREPRRALDQAWAAAVLYTLEQAKWSFAIRSVQLAPVPSIAPGFGYGLAYQKPNDWLKTTAVATDERFTHPLVRYTDESGFWWTDTDPLFVRYVSTDPAYGLDLSRWSPTFGEYLALRLAQKTCQRITGSTSLMGDLVKLEDVARKRAKSNDANNTPPVFPPPGSWVRARTGRMSSEGESSGSAGLTTTSDPQLPTDFITVTVDGGLEG
ncbi:hypothetical protein [Methylobacterium iners]|uniref:Uncharacterized protein n=1 Tax=Methylobacterium iners TaxID=418707 RepID=A0ABQ4RRX3_9HYPH|nr:hypothetical protein [Methylobacterium iners]GJD92932.1 hypothetical protein OCOJLMKI_0115 [Methylobacterium iners]